MKKILITTTEYFDDEKERNRITKYFNNDWQQRLLPILDSFLSNDIQNCIELYNKLPYCEEHECPGQEFICEKIVRIIEKFYFEEIQVTIE